MKKDRFHLGALRKEKQSIEGREEQAAHLGRDICDLIEAKPVKNADEYKSNRSGARNAAAGNKHKGAN